MMELLPVLGALAGKAFDYYQQKHFNPIKKRIQDAQEAGVHPIYGLQAGGFDAPPQMAFGDTFAKMGQSLADTYKQKTNDGKALSQLEMKKATLQNELLQAQLDKIKNPTNAVPTVPPLDPRYVVEGQAQASLPNIPGVTIELPGGHKIQQPQYTPNLTYGLPYRTHPKFSDAQTLEDRYGELAGDILGFGVLGADVYHNMPRMDVWNPSHPLNNQRDYWAEFLHYLKTRNMVNTEVGRRR